MKKKIILPIVAATVLTASTAFTYKQDFFEIAKQIEIFTTLFKTVNQNYVDKTNPSDLMNTAIKSMLKDLDPYTVYFNEQDVIKFKINTAGEYTGIGASLFRKDGRVFITETFKNYSADKAGLIAGDEIIQVNDIKLTEFKEDISQLLRGAKNSVINVKYIRNQKTADTKIVLSDVEIKAVPYYTLLQDKKTGYIVLSQFNTKTTAEVKQALVDLKKQGATQIVLDLQNNPGGLLHEAISLCNLFIDRNEVIVTTKSHDEKHNLIMRTQNEPVDTKIPLAILINEKSASASEIVSGALQDLDRAIIVGNRSFGKGLVQRPIDLVYGTQLKITISKYYTPSGRCIQALDYSHKDTEGKAIKIAEKDFNKFKTKAGRIVYDGGGINPDFILNDVKQSNIAKVLDENRVIFNYATKFYFENANTKTISQITDATFIDFKKYAQTQNLDTQSETEKALITLEEVSKKEKINDQLQTQITNLKTALKNTIDIEIDKNKTEIKRLLLEDLIKRYHYQEGLYEYYTKNNAIVNKAITVLNDKTLYNKTLNVK